LTISRFPLPSFDFFAASKSGRDGLELLQQIGVVYVEIGKASAHGELADALCGLVLDLRKLLFQAIELSELFGPPFC
jgi:hypothetical protein